MTRRKIACALSVLALSLAASSAQAARFSGAAFHPNSAADAPFITYAMGAVTNTDPNTDRTVVVDVGFLPANSDISGTINWVGNDGPELCNVITREVASGAATRTPAGHFGQIGRNDMVLPIVRVFVATSVSLECILPHTNVNGQAYIYFGNVNGMP